MTLRKFYQDQIAGDAEIEALYVSLNGMIAEQQRLTGEPVTPRLFEDVLKKLS
jgi:hypothetical protein